MNQITRENLENLVNRINELTNSPLEYSDKTILHFKANIGHYYLDGAYGGWKLARITSESGGQADISTIGYVSKGDLHNFMQAYISGLEFNIK